MRKRALSGLTVIAAGLLLTSCAVQTAPSGSSTDDSGSKELVSIPGFDAETGTITLGQMTALSGPVAPTAGEQVLGQQAYWDYLNEKGGIAGKYKVEVTTADNQYNPQLAVQEYQKLKGNVLMLSGVLGDASVEALTPILAQDEAVALPSTQSARFANNANLAPTFTSYETNAWNAISYLFDDGRITADSTVCGFIQADQSGEARTTAIEWGAEKLGYTVGPMAEFAPTDAAFTAQIQALKSANCDLVIFGGAANNLPNVVAASTQLEFGPEWVCEFFALSNSFKDSEIAGYLEDHFTVTGLAGNLNDTEIEGIKLLTDLIAPTEVTTQHVYGFMQGITAAAVLEKAVELGDISGPGLQNAIDEIDTISYMDLNGDITYGPVGSRVLPDTSALFSYDRTAQYGLNSLGPLYVAPEGQGPDF